MLVVPCDMGEAVAGHMMVNCSLFSHVHISAVARGLDFRATGCDAQLSLDDLDKKHHMLFSGFDQATAGPHAPTLASL